MKNMAAVLDYRYVTSDENILSGEPIIKGTRTPVLAIVELWRMSVAPEEIPKRLPHLTLAQVFDAPEFYCDNKEEINSYIERNRIPDELIDPLMKNDCVEKEKFERNVSTNPRSGWAE
jgi:uncharacterized protein (DUF433 family)